MKTLFLLLTLALCTTVHAQEIPKITPDQAKDYIGKTVTICGDVMGTYVSKSGTTFLNFGADYPNQVFSVIIYADDAKKFSEAPATAFKGKDVCVRGVVKLYKEKPEIEVTSTSQMEIK